MKSFRKYELYCKPSKVGEGKYEDVIINNSADVFDACKMLGLHRLTREKVYALYLDNANHLIGVTEVSSGALAGTVVDPKVVIGFALRIGRVGRIILVHNHPSNNLTPSKEDYDITKKLIKAGALFDIKIVDHLIIGNEAFNSMWEYDSKVFFDAESEV